MKSRIYRNLIILIATALTPCVLLAYWGLQDPSSSFASIIAAYLLVHLAIWLCLIPAFRKFPITSLVLSGILYPIIALCGMFFIYGGFNPAAAVIGLLWLGSAILFELGWLAFPVSFANSTIAYLLTYKDQTRNQPDTKTTDRSTAAPTS